MGDKAIDYPALHLRIEAYTDGLFRSGEWRYTGSGRLYAAQWLRWSLLLQIRGCPGRSWRDYSCGGLRAHAEGKELYRAVMRELVRKKLVRVGHRSGCDVGILDDVLAFEWRLWEWLDENTPAANK